MVGGWDAEGTSTRPSEVKRLKESLSTFLVSLDKSTQFGLNCKRKHGERPKSNIHVEHLTSLELLLGDRRVDKKSVDCGRHCVMLKRSHMVKTVRGEADAERRPAGFCNVGMEHCHQ